MRAAERGDSRQRRERLVQPRGHVVGRARDRARLDASVNACPKTVVWSRQSVPMCGRPDRAGTPAADLVRIRARRPAGRSPSTTTRRSRASGAPSGRICTAQATTAADVHAGGRAHEHRPTT
jgi:hypothetical protein